jgi:diacylglycerol kinase (ATP)
MRTAIILNPTAGSASDINGITQALAALGDIHIDLTCSPEHAEACATGALENNYRRIVAAGGDGTINRILNGLAAAPGGIAALREIELGILPLGTGNDLSYSIGMNLPLSEAIDALIAWKTRPVDIIRLDAHTLDGKPISRLFLNASAGGFVKSVGQTTDPALKRTALGALAYAFNAAASLDDVQHYNAEITADSQPLDHRAIATLVSSGRTIGGGIEAAPDARLDDGLVDLLIIPEASLSELLMAGIEALTGAAAFSKLLETRRAREIHITATPPMPLSADGEEAGHTPATYIILPRAIHMVFGPGA